MTDFAAEQEMEMEALQAILMDDLQPYSGTLPDDWPAVGQTYMVAITPSEDSEAKPVEFPMEMEMMFAHTARYPEEPPCVRLLSVRGLSDAAVAEATSMVREQIEQNLGMAMIFTLVSAAKEWLRGARNTEATAALCAPGLLRGGNATRPRGQQVPSTSERVLLVAFV